MSTTLDELGRRASAAVTTPPPAFEALSARASEIERVSRRRRRVAWTSAGLAPVVVLLAVVSLARGPSSDIEATGTPTVEAMKYEEACRGHLLEVQDQVPTGLEPVLNEAGASAKVFEPRFVNGDRIVVLFDDRHFYWCDVRANGLFVGESGGGAATLAVRPTEDQVQVVAQSWSGTTEPDGSCVGQPCGPGSVTIVGRVGSSVASTTVVLPDGSTAAASIEADGWFVAFAQVPPNTPLFQQRIRWALEDGTEYEADAADLASDR